MQTTWLQSKTTQKIWTPLRLVGGSTPLKNVSQNGNIPQIAVKIWKKNETTTQKISSTAASFSPRSWVSGPSPAWWIIYSWDWSKKRWCSHDQQPIIFHLGASALPFLKWTWTSHTLLWWASVAGLLNASLNRPFRRSQNTSKSIPFFFGGLGVYRDHLSPLSLSTFNPKKKTRPKNSPTTPLFQK